MSPAAPGVGGALPSRSEIEEWPTQHLADAAAQLRTLGNQSVTLFDEHRQGIASPGGTTWEGDAKDAALNRVTADTAVVRRQTAVQDEAAGIAENGGHDVRAAKREALEAITTAEDDGFRVGEDLTVTESRRYDITTIVERNKAAAEHAEDIRWYAERLVQADAFVGQRLETKAAELEGIRFEGEGDGREGAIYLVDNKIKLNPQDGGEDPDNGGYKPHPEYPDHKPNGEWGPGNSGVEGDAEAQKAFDERQKRTGIPIERQKIWVYVTDPETGKTLRREYDGLEPIPGQPGKYTGLEHKLGNKDTTKHQEKFDGLVNGGTPATGTLNGRPIEVVKALEIRTPRPDALPPGAGASAGEATAGPAPVDAGGWGGVHAEGTVPVAGPAGPVSGSAPVTTAPGGAPVTPTWGTHLTPQQMIDSGDPALRVIGEELRRQMQANGQIDPSGTA